MTIRGRGITPWATVLLGVIGCDNSDVVVDRTLQDVGGTGPQQSTTGGTSTGSTSSGGASTGGASATGGTSPSGGVSAMGGSYSTNGGFSAGGATDICLLPIEYSTCAADILRFHFNAATGLCEVFHYGGCGGNANSFDTQQECESKCSPRQTSATGGTSSVGIGGATGTGGSSGLPYCGENGGGWGARICGSAGAQSYWQYSGSAVVTSVGVSSDLPATCTPQRGLTLTIGDGSAIEVGFTMINAEPPALDALLGRHVQAVVAPDSNSGYRGDGELTLSDDNGLILSVKWDMGGMSAIPTSFDDVGIDVNIGPGVCTDRCGGVVHTLRFVAGTSSVELAEGEHGTFQSGSSTYTAYTMICADEGNTCADGYADSSFGIFRNDL